MPRLRLGDAVLAYDAAGAGAPIVFLHGVGSNRSTWAGQLAEFGRDHLAVAVDMRGYAESEADPSTVSLPTFALDVAALIDHLGAGPAHVCGLSMGGLVALHLWRERRDAVRSLVLCDTFASHPVAAAGHPKRMAEIEASTMPELARARMPAVYAPTTDKAVVERGIAVYAKLDKEVYRAASDEVWLQRLEDVARSVTVRTLVLVGEHDTITPPPLSEVLHALIPKSRLALIPAAGHLVNEENPTAFNGLVREFLYELG